MRNQELLTSIGTNPRQANWLNLDKINWTYLIFFAKSGSHIFYRTQFKHASIDLKPQIQTRKSIFNRLGRHPLELDQYLQRPFRFEMLWTRSVNGKLQISKTEPVIKSRFGSSNHPNFLRLANLRYQQWSTKRSSEEQHEFDIHICIKLLNPKP